MGCRDKRENSVRAKGSSTGIISPLRGIATTRLDRRTWKFPRVGGRTLPPSNFPRTRGENRIPSPRAGRVREGFLAFDSAEDRNNNASLSGDKSGTRGYTLIELVFVVGLIVVILGIAMPRLLPVFAFSQLEGSARHIANYGRSAIAYSAFSQEPVTFRFDFETGEYRTLRWVEKQDESIFEGSKIAVQNQPFKLNAETALQLVNQQGLTPEERALQMVEFDRQLDLAFRKSLEARAKNVPREGMLADIDPLAKFEFSLDTDEEDDREEVATSTLSRTALPEGITMKSIRLGNETLVEGTVDVEITPVGLTEEVVFVLQGSDGDTYSVAWDPITGGAHLSDDEESPL